MPLTGKTTDEKIWNYLKAQGLNDFGVAGLMGNLQAESGLRPTNLQNSFENAPAKTGGVGYTDSSYTAAVDSGAYTGFVADRAGYGLAQWTYPTRKQALLNFVKTMRCSIGDLEAQLGFLVTELAGSFPRVLAVLKSAASVQEASDCVLLDFERPANQGQSVKDKRAAMGQAFYNKFAKGSADTMGFTNSSLATVKMISPNKNSPRNKPIDIITIHCFVGQVTAKRGCEVFQPASKKASCNYVTGLDGGIGLCVEEKDRSWCTSSAANDNRAVTIEVASDTAHPYAVTAKAYAALLDLVTDICRRNGKRKLLWLGDKAKTLAYKPAADEMLLTVHRWYAAKACPGEYLFSRQGAIAEEVTKRLGGAVAVIPDPPHTATSFEPYRVRITVTNLNIRKSHTTDSASAGYIKPGVYTIVEEAYGKGATRWGKLKSGQGWISLDYAKKV